MTKFAKRTWARGIGGGSGVEAAVTGATVTGSNA